MNLFRLLYTVRGLVNDRDLNVARYGEVDLYDAINRAKDIGQSLIAEKYPERLLNTSAFSTVASQQAYAVPASVYRWYRVEVPIESDPDGDPTVYRFISYLEKDSTFTGPVTWILGDYVYLDPTPSYTGTNNGSFIYIPGIADATAGATEWDELPACMHSWLPVQAAVMLLQSSGDPRWSLLQTQAEMLLQSAVIGARPASRITGIKYSPYALRL